MRVLFTAFGAHGHIRPMLGVAESLADTGHDVLFATSAEFGPLIASCGFAFAEAGLSDAEAMSEAHRRWPETVHTPPQAWTVRMFREIAGPALAADLVGVIREWHPEVIVREEGEHGGRAAAVAHGLPWVTHGWGSPLAEPTDQSELGAAVLDPCPPSLYVQAPRLHQRHSIRPSAVGEAPPEGRDRTTRRAYVGLGTAPLFCDRPHVFRAAVTALLELGLGVTVTTGDQELREELEGLDGGRVEASPWVDLARLLPTCRVVVCHGGAGTVLAALAAGVPLVLVPQGAPSQARMSAACEARGVARTVRASAAGSAELGVALAEVTSDDRFTSTAAAVAREIAVMPEPSAAVPVLEALVADR